MTTANTGRPITDIFRDLLTQLTALLRNERELAQVEISEKIDQVARGLALMVGGAVLLIPALALAVPAFAPMPASAQTRDVRLSDSQQPGSVIIFPKFINRAPVRTDSPTGPLLPRR